jgi:hypothetical protein
MVPSLQESYLASCRAVAPTVSRAPLGLVKPLRLLGQMRLRLELDYDGSFDDGLH